MIIKRPDDELRPKTPENELRPKSDIDIFVPFPSRDSSKDGLWAIVGVIIILACIVITVTAIMKTWNTW